MPLTAALLLLADSRLPAGGHAHSGSMEAATVAGLVDDVDGLEGFLRGRLATAGVASAGLAATACGHAAETAAGAPGRTRGQRLGPGRGPVAGGGLSSPVLAGSRSTPAAERITRREPGPTSMSRARSSPPRGPVAVPTRYTRAGSRAARAARPSAAP
jgi:urease accessory protein